MRPFEKSVTSALTSDVEVSSGTFDGESLWSRTKFGVCAVRLWSAGGVSCAWVERSEKSGGLWTCGDGLPCKPLNSPAEDHEVKYLTTFSEVGKSLKKWLKTTWKSFCCFQRVTSSIGCSDEDIHFKMYQQTFTSLLCVVTRAAHLLPNTTTLIRTCVPIVFFAGSSPKLRGMKSLRGEKKSLIVSFDGR